MKTLISMLITSLLGMALLSWLGINGSIFYLAQFVSIITTILILFNPLNAQWHILKERRDVYKKKKELRDIQHEKDLIIANNIDPVELEYTKPTDEIEL